MKSPLTTLCYIEKEDKYLMLHRVSKENDVNKDKWIGIGGHFEEGESPEECLLRETKEETGLILTSWKFRGIITFVSDEWPTEYMCLYTADGFEAARGAKAVDGSEVDRGIKTADELDGDHREEQAEDAGVSGSVSDGMVSEELPECDEGVLEWVPKAEVTNLNLWEGDKIFLKMLAEDAPFFSMKLIYRGDVLSYASVNGNELELFDICDNKGNPTGKVTERSVAHATGAIHRTAHVWIVRQAENGSWQILLQKRSQQKDSFPGCMDTSSAGHVQAGCECLESARRELKEELGIDASEEDLTYVGYFDDGDVKAEFNGKPFHDHEIAFVHVYEKEIDINQLILQKEEVDAVQWMDYHECRSLVAAGDKRFCLHLSGLELVGRYLGIVSI